MPNQSSEATLQVLGLPLDRAALELRSRPGIPAAGCLFILAFSSRRGIVLTIKKLFQAGRSRCVPAPPEKRFLYPFERSL